MKFIGQFIQSLVARFRNDVYLEDISTGTIASGGNLGLDANNKLVKADTNDGELSITNASDNRVVTSTGGTGLNAESTLTYGSETLTITSTSSSRPGVNLTNTNADENAPTFNFIKVGGSAADDDNLGSIAYTSTNDAAEGYTYANFVTTIADASDGDESGKVAIKVLADGNLRNFIDGTGSSLDVVDVNIGHGTSSQTVIAGDFSAKAGLLSYANENLSLDSSTSARPNLFLMNSNTDAEAPTVTFQKQQTGADNDDIGIIRFEADDDGNNLTSFAEILGEIETAADGSEGGNLILKVASHDGEMQEGIKISDGSAEDEIDVTIGSGAASLTTITGTLTMGSTAFVDNSGVVQVATQGTIDHDSLANFVAAEHYRWDTDISSTATIHTNNITDLHGAGVSGSADQLLTDNGDGTVTSESEAKIITEGGISQFLKNAGSDSFVTGTNSNASFNAYEDVIYYDPTHTGGTHRGMLLTLVKAIDGDFSSGTLNQIAGSFSSFDFGDNTGATAVNLTGLDVAVTGTTSGTTSAVGIDLDVISSDVNDGITITTTDGSASTGHDIKIASSADAADFFGIRTFGSGETEITTVDSDGANAADLKLDIDGDITLDSVTGNIVGQTNGSTYTPSADSHLATKKYVDDNIPDEKAANGDKFVLKYVKVVADQSACNSMHSTPVQLIAAQGSDTIIVLGPGYLFVDKNTAIAQAESAADLNFHFADQEPGNFGTTSLMHVRRFMNADNADRIYMLNGNEREVGQSLTEGTNKAIEASFDSAITSNSITSVTFHLSYYVIDLS